MDGNRASFGLRPFEILIFIIAALLLGICLTVAPLVSSEVEKAIREAAAKHGVRGAS